MSRNETAAPPAPRSKLFVPGSRPELFGKALASAADALSFDLEDAVSPGRKSEARDALAAFLQDAPARTTAKLLIVRVNPVDGPHFRDDVAAIVAAGVPMINLPKPDTAATVRIAADALRAAAAAAGRPAPRLLLNIESARAVRIAAELALADPLVAGLQLGLGDLFEPLGIHRREPMAIAQAMFAVRLAAAEAGVYALDSAFADIADADGFRAEADLARRFGFAGKSCIHPSQVAAANLAFLPDAAEVAHALKVVAAAAIAEREQRGAYVVDGRMIDGPFVDRARAVVATARAAGLIERPA